MKKNQYLSVVMLASLALVSCKSSESAYRKAWKKAQTQEQAADNSPVVESTYSEGNAVASSSNMVAPTGPVRQEKITVIEGADIKGYSVVVGSFGMKANAQNLKAYLTDEGYEPVLAFNAAKAMYRVILQSFDSYEASQNARDSFKAKYPSRADFQASWLLYRVY